MLFWHFLIFVAFYFNGDQPPLHSANGSLLQSETRRNISSFPSEFSIILVNVLLLEKDSPIEVTTESLKQLLETCSLRHLDFPNRRFSLDYFHSAVKVTYNAVLDPFQPQQKESLLGKRRRLQRYINFSWLSTLLSNFKATLRDTYEHLYTYQLISFVG